MRTDVGQQDFGLEGHPQAALLECLSTRILRHMAIADWRDIISRAWQEPIQVETVTGTALCIQCPSWGKYPNLQADVSFLARSLGGLVDVCADNEALVLVDDADAACGLAMKLRELATGIRLHIGMATGTCAVARVRCSGRMLSILTGPVFDQATSACDLTPAGTVRMSPSTFTELRDAASILDSCMLQTEYEGDEVVAISVTPPPLRASEQLSSFAGLGLT